MCRRYEYAAIIEFKTALEIDSMSWIAQVGLSYCCAARYNYNLALEWMAKAIENVPAKVSSLVKTEFLPKVAGWLSTIGDSERAIIARREVWGNDIYHMTHLSKYIREMEKGGRNQDLVAFIMEINTFKSDNEHCENLLVKLLINATESAKVFVCGRVFTAMGTALNAINSSDARTTFLGACAKAITAADAIEAENDEPTTRAIIRMHVASFKYGYCDQTREALTLWQQAIDLIDAFGASDGDCLVRVRTMCTNAICEINFDAAIEAKERGEDSAPWVDSLKGHACFSIPGFVFDSWGFIYSTTYAIMIYGVWLRNHGDGKEAVWKKCFQDAMVLWVDILSGDKYYRYHNIA